MEAAWIARARWRWRGAWLWPAFVVTALLDGIVAVIRPFVGDRQSAAGGVLAGLTAAGLARHGGIVERRHALADAVVRAEAFIGDRAPATFRANASHTDTFTIQAGSVYRTCAPSQDGRRSYCVIVKPKLSLARSVVFDGYEPNWLFAEGVN